MFKLKLDITAAHQLASTYIPPGSQVVTNVDEAMLMVAVLLSNNSVLRNGQVSVSSHNVIVVEKLYAKLNLPMMESKERRQFTADVIIRCLAPAIADSISKQLSSTMTIHSVEKIEIKNRHSRNSSTVIHAVVSNKG